MIWLNGDRTDTASMPIEDRGYLLGDGLFETLLAKDGKPVFIDLHLDRLYQSLPVMAMPPRYERAEIAAAVTAIAADVSAQAESGRGVVRLTVTRTGGRGLVADTIISEQNWLITGTPVAAPPDEMSVAVSDICRPSSAPTSRLKSVNYLDNILARREALAAGADEALLLNEHGRLACGAAANIFIISDQHILTPPVAEGALPGTRRRRLLEQAKTLQEQTGLALIEVAVTRQQLMDCEAAFLTNSLMGAVPISHIENRPKEKSPAMQAISKCLAD